MRNLFEPPKNSGGAWLRRASKKTLRRATQFAPDRSKQKWIPRA
jgi:hypothetical protein